MVVLRTFPADRRRCDPDPVRRNQFGRCGHNAVFAPIAGNDMRRFFIDLPDRRPPQLGQRAQLDPEESKHLLTVMRAERGDVLSLTDGRGHDLTAELVRADKRRCEVRITGVANAANEVSPPRLHLACAVVKGRRFETALEKAVELGVHTITPLATERGVVAPRDGKLERWQHLLIAALKQSGRCHLPRLHAQSTPAAVLDAAGGPVLYGAAPDDALAQERLSFPAAADRLRDAAGTDRPPPAELVLLIGPEGGWSPGELRLLAVREALPLVLAPHVLRTETAAVAGVTILQQLRGLWQAPPRA
jgi:16S rRNA (uracil1498-N3)-methyltransferase